MAHQYEGKSVRVLRDAREGDKGWVKYEDQILVQLADGTEKVVKRDEVTEK